MWPLDGKLEYDNWIIARTVEAAQWLVLQDTAHVDTMSLDHDLEQELSGHDFLKWYLGEIEARRADAPERLVIHTANEEGAKNMLSYVNSWLKIVGADLGVSFKVIRQEASNW